jgi:hypothetical protein
VVNTKFEIPKEAFDPNSSLEPCIKAVYVKTENGKNISKKEVEMRGQRFMYNGVFDQKPNCKLGNMQGWSVIKGLADIILFYRPYTVVEIGAGESTRVLAEAAENAEVKFYSVDIQQHKLSYHTHWQENILGNSLEFIKTFDEKCGLVLIDANHTYEVAKQEFDFFFEKLVPGGVIFLHDTFPCMEEAINDQACGDVYKLRQELEKRTDEMDCFTWPYTAIFNGLTMVIKKDKDRPYWGK